MGTRVNLWPLGPVLAAPAAYLALAVVGRAWSDCDVGVNAGANGLTLMIILPVLWVIEGVLSGAAIALAAARFRAPWPVQVAIVLLCLAVLGYGAVWCLVTAAGEWPACPPRGRPPWLFWLF
jgi:hypothetical protein